jgi:hypothetical protein
MPDDKVPQGIPFKVLYHPPTETIADSLRARRRIALAMLAAAEGDAYAVSQKIEGQLGTDAPHNFGMSNNSSSWRVFAERSELVDLLTSITIVARHLADTAKGQPEYLSRPQMERLLALKLAVVDIFAQEGLPYRLDSKCGVHPLIDSAFSLASASAISSLNGDRYKAARAYVDAIDDALLQAPPDGVTAIYKAFMAAENLFKMMFPADRLVAYQVDAHLRPAIRDLYGDERVSEVSDFEVTSFIKWLSGALKYRHAEGEPDPPSPPREVYILVVSQGLSFVRWLAEIDRQLQAKVAI